jgi:hypothetical protein
MSAKRPRKVRMYVPPRPRKPKVPDSLKALVAAKAEELINGYLKPAHIEPPPKKAKVQLHPRH